jgi:hypothetical protein
MTAIAKPHNPITKALITCHFLIWSATKRSDFHLFEASLGKIVTMESSYSKWSSEFLIIQISFHRFRPYVDIPWQAVEAYGQEFGNSAEFLCPDVPF